MISLNDMTDKEFNLYQDFIEKTAGLAIKSSRKELLAGKIKRRLKVLNIHSFKEYYRFVNKEKNGELPLLLDNICTHETHFFREARQFEFMAQQLFPCWKSKASAGLFPKRIRVWSTACSTGEEPYSLAMILWTYFPPASGWKVDILASDLSMEVLERAHAGVWPIEKAKEIPEKYLRAYMLRGTGSQEGKIKAGSEIRSLIRFENINLNEKNYPVSGSFELIFCRNVLIYFSAESRKRVVRQLLNYLSPEGYLFMGHSERLIGETDRVISVAPTIYIQSPENLISR